MRQIDFDFFTNPENKSKLTKNNIQMINCNDLRQIMRILSIIILCSAVPLTGFSQKSDIEEKVQIKNVIDQFFEAIEKKDSILMSSAILGDAQVWRRRNNGGLPKIDFRFSKDSAGAMSSWPDMKEIALDYDITANNDIAVAWVPYEFWIEDKFSHCGIAFRI